MVIALLEEYPMPVLREVNGTRVFPLRGKITVLGRDTACDIVVETPATSGRHAMILCSGGVYYIDDLDSVNGTYVNDVRVKERTALKSGDHVAIAGLEATFAEDDREKAALDETALLQTRLEGVETVPIRSSLEVGGDYRVTVQPEAKLRAILEITHNLSNSLDLKVVLPKILESLFTIFPQADRGCILLRDPVTGQLAPKAVRQRSNQGDAAAAISWTIMNCALRQGRAILSADATTDTRFDPTHSILHHQIRSIMCVPLVSQSGSSLGVIQIDTKAKRDQFRQDDLGVLVCASMQAARAVELAQLHQERRDLETATEIQKSFLPAVRPRYDQLQFFDHYSPVQHVGGDYYDYIPLPGNRLAVALGDVEGKGITAALLMARLSSAVRFCLATAASVPDAVRQLNLLQTRTGGYERFVTFVVAVVDLARFSVTLVNAGHPAPIRRQSQGNKVANLGEDIVGLPLGVIDRPYEEVVVPFEPGDTLVLYTDGVSEARNMEGEVYGAERLRAAVQNAAADAEAVGMALLDDVRRFAGARPQSDDMAIVCVGRKK
jgi:serine phosphatase RsbU (regulator of sigma subunit)/pSer/pThr/pTyr-binding forkhead associated (FHA) protein